MYVCTQCSAEKAAQKSQDAVDEEIHSEASLQQAKSARSSSQIRIPLSKISFTLSSVYHSTTRSTYSQEKTNKTKTGRGCCVYVAAPIAKRKKGTQGKKGNTPTKTTKLPSTSAPSTPALIGRNMQRCASPRLLQTQEKKKTRGQQQGQR